MVLVDPKVVTIKIPYGSTSPLPLRLHPVKPPSQVTASEGALGSSLAEKYHFCGIFVWNICMGLWFQKAFSHTSLITQGLE